MEGFPYYFHVRAGNPVLKHPLYQKYNMLKIEDIEDGAVIQSLNAIAPSNDNWPIIWYLSSLLKVLQSLRV
tara:strand:+ start:89 stop:301 length:213 start_codon:yes stop_codon:yes gene_type:complete